MLCKIKPFSSIILPTIGRTKNYGTASKSLINSKAFMNGIRLEYDSHQQFPVKNPYMATNQVIGEVVHSGEQAKSIEESKSKSAYAASFFGLLVQQARTMTGHKLSSPSPNKSMPYIKQTASPFVLTTTWNFPNAILTRKLSTTASHGTSTGSYTSSILPYKTTIINRHFHAAGSKVNYLDFRYRFKTNHLRLHLLIIRRQKMKKHKRIKFRKKYKCLLAKQRLKREIAKEKTFRVELLTMIRRAETFDPREYALRKITEANKKPKELSKQERLEELKELIRQNRHQVTYIKPTHRRADI